MARRSPSGCGAKSPGTDALAATARGAAPRNSPASTSRSPVYASTALTARLRAGHRHVWVISTTLDGSRLTPGRARRERRGADGADHRRLGVGCVVEEIERPVAGWA